ncbi:MAG: TIGR01777 family oxidoreductase, partial [Parabacteroides sp.]|nr:TIGR01777 family oxidoreductase [Parabacteroides sp.]
NSLAMCDVVVNLAGASINGRWTKAYKREIMNSRVDTTRQLVTAINNLDNAPSLFISVSAVGIYASNGIHNESSQSLSTDFLAQVCKAWENEASQLKPSTRLVIARLGVVLGADGGAAPIMLTPFRFYLGSTFGSGEQGFSWIHMEDLLHAFEFIIDNSSIYGIVNLTSPEITTNKQFCKTVAQVLRKPCWFSIPSFVFKLLLGESHILITKGQQAFPEILLNNGYIFSYSKLSDAIKSIK